MAVSNAFDFFIQLHLTERCNLNCSHCYQSGSPPGELTLQEIRDLVHETAAMLDDWSSMHGVAFTPSFNVTGGEPLLRRDLFAVLETIAGQGFGIYLLSNGTLVDGAAASALAAHGVAGVQVSVEGPQEIHDSLRGQGSLAAALRGVRQLLDAGIEVTLNTTLSAINAPHVMAVVELASSLSVQRLGFSRLVPAGRGKGLLDRSLDGDELATLYRRVFSLQVPGLQIVTGDPVAAQLRREAADIDLSQIPSAGCAAGLSGLTIMPDGSVTPCRRMRLAIGNVKIDSLRELWALSPVLNRLRDRTAYAGKCGTCRRWSVCRGCRAIALAHASENNEKGYLAEDPHCFIQDGGIDA